MASEYEIIRTPSGLRLRQHGVVLSEILSRPGPTHSIFDVLAALSHALRPLAPVALLGFAGGGFMAPLRALSPATPVFGVDLDRGSYDLFVSQCGGWAGPVEWRATDALGWLRAQTRRWEIIIDDLSVVADRRVVKPVCSYGALPGLIRSRLRPRGVAICNLLRPEGRSWCEGLRPFTVGFRAVTVIHLDEFENRVVVAGQALLPARELGRRLRRTLQGLESRQFNRLRVQSLVV